MEGMLARKVIRIDLVNTFVKPLGNVLLSAFLEFVKVSQSR